MEKVYIGIGSNKGNRVENIKKSLKELEKISKIKKISFFYKNPPINAKGGYFLNGIVELEVDISPYELLKNLKEIEKKIGRKIPHEKGDAREIDLDIIFYGKSIIKSLILKIPHPEYRKREFVLLPLLKINDKIIDPETGERVIDIYKKVKFQKI